jgi:hypothetical protein
MGVISDKGVPKHEKTAKAPGLMVSSSLPERADEVIEQAVHFRFWELFGPARPRR